MIDSLVYLIENYWIFLLLAMLVGIATGWISSSDEDAAE